MRLPLRHRMREVQITLHQRTKSVLLSRGNGNFRYASAMKRRLVVGFLGASTLLAANSVLADRVDDYLKKEMAGHHIPGVALTIIQNGKTVKTAAYGLANLE